MALNAYATRMKVNDMLSCQKGPKRADLLRIEGASGLPASAVVAVVGINAGLFFFVFGPFGMITTNIDTNGSIRRTSVGVGRRRFQ